MGNILEKKNTRDGWMKNNRSRKVCIRERNNEMKKGKRGRKGKTMKEKKESKEERKRQNVMYNFCN